MYHSQKGIKADVSEQRVQRICSLANRKQNMGIGLPLHAKHSNACAGKPTEELLCTPVMPLLYSIRGLCKKIMGRLEFANKSGHSCHVRLGLFQKL